MQYKHYKIEYERMKAYDRRENRLKCERMTEYVVGLTKEDAINTFYNYISQTRSHDRHTLEILFPIISIEEEKE